MKKMKPIRLLCVMSTLVCGCTPVPDTQKTPDPDYRNETSSDVEEKVYQDKLNSIYPEAYSNTDGIYPDPEMYISVVGRRGRGAYWREIEKGASQAIDDLNEKMGYEGEEMLKMTYNGPINHLDVGEQVNILDEELARNPRAVAISLIDRDSCKIQFDLAAESGINIVTFDSGSEYEGISASIKEENAKISEEAADRMSGAVSEKGRILIVSSSSKNAAFRERDLCFREKIVRDYPEISIENTLYTDENVLETDDKEEEFIVNAVKKHPDINGLYVTDELALRMVINAIDNEDFNHIKVVGFGGEKDVVESQSFERVEALVCENPFGMGYATVIAAVRAGISAGNEAEIHTGYRWVTRDNKDDAHIVQWLY